MSSSSFFPQIPQEETDNKVLLFKYPFPKTLWSIVTLIILGILNFSSIILKVLEATFYKYLQHTITQELDLDHYQEFS